VKNTCVTHPPTYFAKSPSKVVSHTHTETTSPSSKHTHSLCIFVFVCVGEFVCDASQPIQHEVKQSDETLMIFMAARNYRDQFPRVIPKRYIIVDFPETGEQIITYK